MDCLHPFIFENTAIRGNMVALHNSYQEALQHQSLPSIIKQTLGELMVANALLISSLKMQGKLIMQLQGNGKLKLLVAECTSDLAIRATAKWHGDINHETLSELVGDGQFVITLQAENREPYQGIVSLEGGTVAKMLEQYMQRSQQIDTQIQLFCDEQHASGLLLQKLPAQQLQDSDDWQRVCQLANTVTHQELCAEQPQQLLHQLFNEDDIRLFEQRAINAHCSCNQQYVANMLKTLGEAEINDIIKEQGRIEVNCDFCNKHYLFNENDCLTLFHPEQTATKH